MKRGGEEDEYRAAIEYSGRERCKATKRQKEGNQKAKRVNLP